MTTENDVRQMLERRAASVRVSGDGLDQIDAKLVARPRRTQLPRTYVTAAAVFAVVLASMAVYATRDRSTEVVLTPAEESTTSVPAPASALPLGVWPWPSDDVQVSLTDPVETARAYIETRVGMSDTTTVSDYQAGDTRSGEVVFGGDISTTVLVRELDDVWHVEGATSDLVTLHDRGDGTSTARAEAAGWLQSFVQLSTGDSSAALPAQAVSAGYEVANGIVAFDLDTNQVVKRVRFLLTTADGVKGLSEVGVRPPVTPTE